MNFSYMFRKAMIKPEKITFAAMELSIVNKIGRLSVSMGV